MAIHWSYIWHLLVPLRHI